MAVPKDKRYTRDHEWAHADGDTVTVGITDYAQQQLGDIVFVEFQEAGQAVAFDEPFGTVESTKSVSDLMAPISGVIIEGNDALIADPALLNSDPYVRGWVVKVKATDLSELDKLMSADEYDVYIGSLDHH